MKKRIITATILIMIALPILILAAKYDAPKIFLEVALMLITVGAEIELLNMYDKSKKINIWIKIVTILFTLLLSFSIINWFDLSYADRFAKRPLVSSFLDLIGVNKFLTPFSAIIIIFIVYMAMLVLVKDFEVNDAGRLFVSVFYVGICVGAFTVLLSLGIRLVIYLLAITVFTDIFALVFGMLLGKHKMAPVISPKKTWEGAIGGTCTAVIVGTIIVLLYPQISNLINGESKEFFEGIFNFEDFSVVGKVFFTIILTIFLSICSQIGDLVASKLKRAYGIKDYSNIFPGHGGILDRFDSAFFASAIFLLFILIALCLFA